MHTGLPNSLLTGVSDQLDLCVARAIEIADGETLPHEVVLRKRVSHGIFGSERTPTPLRLFCMPFEDLLTAAPRQGVKQKGRIARESIAPIWTWLSRTLLPRETRSYSRAVRSATATADHAQSRMHAAKFWQIAGAAMREALAGEPSRSAARQALKSEVILADAREAALMLCNAQSVMKVHELLVRPVGTLSDARLQLLRAIYDGVAFSDPGAAPYVAMIAMNRLASPWEVLKLPGDMSDLVGGIMFGDIQRYAEAVRNACHSDFDVDLLLDNIEHFTWFYSGIAGRNDSYRDSKLARLLVRERAALAETVGDLMRRAPSILAEALRRPDADKVDRALRTVRLVRGCKPFEIALGASVREAEDVMCRMLLSHNEHLFERRAGNSGPTEFATCVKLTNALFGAEHGEFLRRRFARNLQVA